MKSSIPPELEKKRVTKGVMGSDSSYGFNGAFKVITPDRIPLICVVSDEGGWDHVSISPIRAKRTPTWAEMCYVKSLFWDDDETVIQYHPPKADYINVHDYTLHLWRPQGEVVPMPPIEYV